MKKSDIEKFSSLYHSAHWGGADQALRKFYSLDSNSIIPFSIAHGIDMHQTHNPLDVQSIEPIHWAYNEQMYQKSNLIKPSIRLPHPFLFFNEPEKIQKKPFLLIGPPPSDTNDKNLYIAMQGAGYHDYDILVKERGETSDSYDFWTAKGISTVTAGHPDSNFYPRLHKLLSGYDCLIGCTMSGALVFGSALGCKIKLITGYSYLNYETLDYEDVLNCNAETPKRFLRLAEANRQDELKAFSREILGEEFLKDHDQRRSSILKIVETTPESIFWKVQHSNLEKKLRIFLAIYFQKPLFLSGSIMAILKKFTPQKVVKVQINEIDMYLNGKSKSNFKLEKVKYNKNINEPGSGAD